VKAIKDWIVAHEKATGFKAPSVVYHGRGLYAIFGAKSKSRFTIKEIEELTKHLNNRIEKVNTL
jgi:S-adenosylmethionine hydrolase